MKNFTKTLLASALLLIVLTNLGWGQVNITVLGSTYTQSFNTLAKTGTSSVVPTGWMFSESGTSANTVYTAGTGSSNSGDTWSFGASNDSDRCFGTLLSGSLTSTVGASFMNNTGSVIIY